MDELEDEKLKRLLQSGVPYDSPRDLSVLLTELGFGMSKRFGQNFMVNPSSRKKIAELAGPIEGSSVWEIGPGLGALTSALVTARSLVAFEIDRGFIRVLHALFDHLPAFRLVEGDALKLWDAVSRENGGRTVPDAVVGNLPYNVGSVLIARMLEAGFIADRMVFTLQKEVARRLCARAGDEEYSSLSVLCSARCAARVEAELAPANFFPRPDVTSAVILLRPRGDGVEITDSGVFAGLVRSMFASRRKTLENNLKASEIARKSGFELLAACAGEAGIDLKKRAEAVPTEDYIGWANLIAARQAAGAAKRGF